MVNCIGHIACKNCLLEHVIEQMVERRTEVTRRRGRRRKHILDDLKKMTGYLKPEVESLDHAVLKNSFRKRL